MCASPDAFVGGAPLSRRLDCFDAGDLAALAGDHASTPDALRARWLDGPADARPSTAAGFLDGTWEASDVAGSPVGCRDEARGADADRLFAAMRDLPTLTTAIVRADGAYLCLAAHNAHHFRLVRLDPVAAAVEPVPNAFGAYAYYHLNALAAASRADRAGGDARAALLARAMLLELYSEHFLEDALAGGHVATDRARLNAGSVQRTHAWHNRAGVALAAGEALRRRADEVIDTGWGGARDDRARFVGDDELLAVLDGRGCEGAGRDRCRTLAAGAALVSLSLEELTAPRPADLDARLAACETRGDCGSPRAAQDALDAGLLAAVRAAPRAAEWTRTLEAPTIGRLTRLRTLGGLAYRTDAGAFAPAAELSLWGELMMPPFVIPGDLYQMFVGVGVHARPEWPARGDAFARPAGARVEAGLSTTRMRLGLGLGAEVAAFGTAWADARPALSLELDAAARADTHDDLAWLVDLVPSFSVARYGGVTRWTLGVALGVSFERPATRATPCAFGRGGDPVEPCVGGGAASYARLAR